MTTSRRHSNSRRDSRRKNNRKVLQPVLVACSNCGAMKLPHRICKECGYYNGKLVVAKKVKEKQPKK
ncbi:MAG: 50S ribosomal protein L32 [Candidatus Omnitrophica bacterium]|nr:50S ribosomal protein L32 [Candidatus Omnitrophota bacterium]MCM8825401.1 50S ribosomal protein L32 [Candidatus Omnitrophota bacterium]